MAILLCGHIGTSSAANDNNNGGVISLKLNPRHVELERRRRERRLLSGDDDDEESAVAVLDDENYRRRGEAKQVGALFEGYGTHYVDLWVGSPPQRQTVIVDTGSGITAFPCGGCRECGAPNYHIDRLFIEEESKTFQKSTCSNQGECIMRRSSCSSQTCLVSMAYAEGSRWSAYEAVDRCYVAGPHEIPLVASQGSTLEGDDMNPRHAADLAFDMTFGCQTLVTGLFKTQLADGIMGMSNQGSTYWSQMFKANKMGSDKQFALCFSRPPRITKEGTEAGAMTLGGVDTRLHLTPMVYTPAFNKGRTNFFSTKIRRMMLREGAYGESAKSTDDNPNKGVTVLDLDESILNKGGTIVDSGTTDTYWNSGIATEFKRVFKQITGKEHDNHGVKLTDDELLALPTILIQLVSDDEANAHVDDMFHTPGLTGALDKLHKSDVILAIPPSHYMEYNDKTDDYTSRFYPTERSGNVLGANAMMGHDIFFDVDNTRIGWAESACDYTRTVHENGYDFDITGRLKPVEKAGTTSGSSSSKSINNNNPCESVSSGRKCQNIEGCAWGWGKCTKVGEADAPPEETPTEKEDAGEDAGADVEPPVSNTPEEPSSSAESSSKLDIEADIEESILQQIQAHAVGIGAFFILALVLCCTVCLFCRTDNNSGNKYAKASLEPVSIEMTSGNESKSSFQDEPDSDDDDDDSDDDLAIGSGAESNFRDEPEFDGDFA